MLQDQQECCSVELAAMLHVFFFNLLTRYSTRTAATAQQYHRTGSVNLASSLVCWKGVECAISSHKPHRFVGKGPFARDRFYLAPPYPPCPPVCFVCQTAPLKPPPENTESLTVATHLWYASPPPVLFWWPRKSPPHTRSAYLYARGYGHRLCGASVNTLMFPRGFNVSEGRRLPTRETPPYTRV